MKSTLSCCAGLLPLLLAVQSSRPQTFQERLDQRKRFPPDVVVQQPDRVRVSTPLCVSRDLKTKAFTAEPCPAPVQVLPPLRGLRPESKPRQ